MTSNILTAFNDQLSCFIDDMLILYPNDVDIMYAKNSFNTIRKMNPRLVISVWQDKINSLYFNQIMSGDLEFFLNKDYSTDLAESQNSSKIMDSINRLRQPIRSMDTNNREKAMRYLQNISNLSNLYFSK